MNKLFKLSLLAGAVAAAGAANAGTFTLNKALYSAEGVELLSAAEQKAAADLVYNLDTDYEAGTTLTFTFSDGALAESNVFPESVLTVDVGANGIDDSVLVKAAADAAAAVTAADAAVTAATDAKTAADALLALADALKTEADAYNTAVVGAAGEDAIIAVASVDVKAAADAAAADPATPTAVKDAVTALNAALALPNTDAAQKTAKANAITAAAAGLITPADDFATAATADAAAKDAANTTAAADKVTADAAKAAADLAAAGADDDLDNVATFTKSTTTANSVTYKLTAKASDTESLKNSIFVLPAATAVKDGVVLNTAAIKAGPVTVTADSVYEAVPFDPDTTTKGDGNEDKNQLAATATQFGKFAVSAAADEFINGTIDLTADNELAKVLTDATDKMVVAYTAPAADKMPAYAVIGSKDVNVNVGNDLSATKLTTAYEVVAQLPGFEASQIASVGGDAAVTAKGLKVSFAEAIAPKASATLTLSPAADKNDALVVQHFSVIPTVKYNDQVVTFDALAAGNWTIDAETVNIPYMPYGESISQIIYATNSSAVDAQVSATAIDENGQSYALGVVGTAKGNGAVTKLSGGINAALAAKGFTKGKVSIELLFAGVAAVDTTFDARIATATLPKGAIKVQSAYNVKGADRGFVTNTSNGSY